MEELENTSSLFNTSPKNSLIDPPKKSIFNTQAIKPISNTTNLSGNVIGYNTGIGDSMFDEGITASSDLDENDISGSVNEYRAQNQSWISKVPAGTARILTKGISEILKMPGVIGGIVASPFADENEGFETAFNNEWVKSVNKLNEDFNSELLPVYVKKAVQEGNLLDNISSVDFWATEGADGIGYIVSMLAPGAALKSLNVGEKLLGATAFLTYTGSNSELKSSFNLFTDLTHSLLNAVSNPSFSSANGDATIPPITPGILSISEIPLVNILAVPAGTLLIQD